ncbi:MAG: RecR, partial [uncultured Acidimicrobiales bacterium]
VRRSRPGPDRRVRPAARHRPQVGPAHRLPPPEAADGGRHAPVPLDRRGEGEGLLLPPVLERGRDGGGGRDRVRHLPRHPAGHHDPLRGRGAARHRGHREDPGVQGPLPRAAGDDEPHRGRRPRPAAHQGAGGPARAGGHRRDHPLHQPEHRRRDHGRLPGPAAQAARHAGHPPGQRPPGGGRPRVRRRADPGSCPRRSPRHRRL